MSQGLLQEVPELDPAESSPAAAEPPAPRESAFAEHLRLLDNAVSQTRARAQAHEKELMRLEAQVRRLKDDFAALHQRTEDAELCLPLPPPPPISEPLVVPPPLAVRAAPRLWSLWPYAALAAIALALSPKYRPMPQLTAEPKPVAAAKSQDSGAAEAVALVRAFTPSRGKRAFGEVAAAAGDWDVQRVDDATYLVSFTPKGAGETSYDFTVDLAAREVTPELDTFARLLARR